MQSPGLIDNVIQKAKEVKGTALDNANAAFNEIQNQIIQKTTAQIQQRLNDGKVTFVQVGEIWMSTTAEVVKE